MNQFHKLRQNATTGMTLQAILIITFHRFSFNYLKLPARSYTFSSNTQLHPGDAADQNPPKSMKLGRDRRKIFASSTLGRRRLPGVGLQSWGSRKIWAWLALFLVGWREGRLVMSMCRAGVKGTRWTTSTK